MGTATLSKRESQIAEMIAWGGAKKEIACTLFISERTVENTARAIYEKTGVSKSNELSAWWFCTKFGISFSLSPLKRQLVSITFLLLVVANEVLSGNVVVRKTRTRTKTETRSRTRRIDGDGIDF